MKKTKEENFQEKKLNEQSKRIEDLISRFFRTPAEFSRMVKVSPSTTSAYRAGKRPISRRTANLIEKSIGVRAEYILFGTGAMMLENSIPAPCEVTQDVVVDDIKIDTDTKTTIRGIMPNSLIVEVGRNKEVLSDSGSVNIIDVAVDGIKNPQSVIVTSIVFCHTYNIRIGSTLVLSPRVNIGDTVLIYDGMRYRLTERITDGYTDINNRDIFNEEVQVIGSVFSCVSKL